MITCVIIDDEPKSVFTLRSFITDNCPQVQVVGTANSAKSGKEIIHELKPHLVFLDIEMPQGSGFDMRRSIANPSFEVIFITAYDQYAITAFKFSAIDYLLKPVRITQLIDAVKKAEKRMVEKVSYHNYETLLKNMSETDQAKQKIVMVERGEQYLVQLDTIKYIVANGNYTDVHTGSKVFLSSKSLKEFEELLPQSFFCRIHHGHIVNLKCISKVHKGRGGSVVMADGKEFEIAVRRKDDFLKVYVK